MSRSSSQPNPSDDDDPSSQHTLVWLEDADGRSHYLNGTATIGRAPASDIRLSSPLVSRYHALLRYSGDAWVLLDLDSTNGTTINGQPTTVPTAVHIDDEIAFGDMRFVLRSNVHPLVHVPTITGPALVTILRTTHFELLAVVGSIAKQHRDVIGERLERAWSALSELLSLPELEYPLHVYLVEHLTGTGTSGRMPVHGGYADPAGLTVYEVYRADAPGTGLERSLLEVASYLALGGANLPSTVAEGLLLLAQQRSGTGMPAMQIDAAVAEAEQQGRLPALPVLLAGGSGDTAQDTVAVAGFLRFVVSAWAPERTARFLRELPGGNAEAASQHAFGTSLATLERRWRKRLRRAMPGGVRLFLRLVHPYLRPYRLKLGEVAIYLLISVLFGVGFARAQGYLLDEALIPGDTRVFAVVMSALAVAFAIVSITSIRENYLRAWISEQIMRDLRQRMFARIQAMHPGYFQRADSGDLLARLTSDLYMVEAALTNGLAESLRLVFMFTAALITVIIIDWRLALVALIGGPMIFLIGRLLGPSVARASIERQTQLGVMTGTIHENLAAQSVVKLYGLERFEAERFDDRLGSLFRVSMRMHVLAGFYNVLTGSLANIVELAVLGIGAWLVLGGDITVGILFTFLFLAGQIIGPLQSISGLLQFVQQATGSLQRVRELVEAEPELVDTADAKPLDRLSREIRLTHVTFDYGGTRPILENVSLVIPAGANVAIVGPSGSGKSTILSLLPRFYDPERGSVAFDGVDLRETTLASVRAQIGMVFQDTVLFNASIRENIRLGNLAASNEEVEEAARAAELHDIIAQLPEGYDTLVGERGGHLSGGQRQRVAIARAILRDPVLLLLDEATSALDPATEAAINGTLRRLATGRTTVSVTHRLASVVGASHIFVLEQGRLVEQGTHDELLRADGLYARLWHEQHGAIKAQPSGVSIDSLQRIPLFAGLDRATVAEVANRLISERHPGNREIVSLGSTGDRLYLIGEGEVEVVAPDAAGAPRRLAKLGPGDYFGEIALLHDVPRTATVRACTQVLLFALKREDFWQLMARSPSLRMYVTQTVDAREAVLDELSAFREAVS